MPDLFVNIGLKCASNEAVAYGRIELYKVFAQVAYSASFKFDRMRGCERVQYVDMGDAQCGVLARG